MPIYQTFFIKMLAVVFLPLVIAASVFAQEGGVPAGKGTVESMNPVIKHTADKLDAMVVDKIEWRGATVREGVDFLQSRCWDLDEEATDHPDRGVRFTLQEDAAPAPRMVAGGKTTLTFLLRNIPMSEALRYLAWVADMKAEIGPGGGVAVLPAAAKSTPGSAPVHYMGDTEHREGYVQGKKDRLGRIVIPKIEFQNATLVEAMTALHEMSILNDVAEPDEERRGVNLIWKAGPVMFPLRGDKITVSLKDVPLGDALDKVAALAGLKVQVDPFAVVLYPAAPAPAVPKR